MALGEHGGARRTAQRTQPAERRVHDHEDLGRGARTPTRTARSVTNSSASGWSGEMAIAKLRSTSD